MKTIIYYFLFAFTLCSFTSFNYEVGQVIDELNGVKVYYNGPNFTNVVGRAKTKDGYNLGLRYQCVEFVKRYYYEKYNHKMPNSYGHAKDLFDTELEDVAFNSERGLMQYRNSRYEKPQMGDILVYGSYDGNGFGHTGIISKVTDNEVELIQQNVNTKSRQKLKLVEFMGIYTIADYNIYGWLRVP